MLCFGLALCAVVAEIASEDEPIPFSEGSDQIFATSDELIQSFRRQLLKASESPAVIPAGSRLPERTPAPNLDTPLESTITGTYPIDRSIRKLTDHSQETRASVTQESASSQNLRQSIGNLPHVPPEQDTVQQSVKVEAGPLQPDGHSVQLPDYIRLVLPEQDTAQESVDPKQQPKLGPAVQLPVLQVIPAQDIQQATINTEPERKNFGKSVQLPEHVQQVLPEQESVNPEPVPPLSNFSGSVPQLSDHILPPLEDTPQKTPDLPNLGTSVQQSPDHVPIEQHATLETLDSPPRPHFNRSLHLRDDLSVPRSGYTEAYDIEWHADSNTARTVIENSTTIYRKPLPDGHIQFLEVKVDRSNGIEVRRCTMSPPLLPTSFIDRAFPGLPDLEPFRFVGYTTEEGRSQTEHWQHLVVGRPGEGGAARGEALNITHDFILFRDGADAVPIRYTVVTDSSVLGPVSDRYTHRYRVLPAPTAPVLPDTTQECDVLEELKAM